MKVHLRDPVEKRFPRFSDIEPSELFILEGVVYVKVNGTQAMVLNGGGELMPVNMHEQINLVHSVAVIPEA